MALMDQTLLQLVTRLASLFDDITDLTATGNGTTTTFVDTFNVNTGTESFDGCEILFTLGSNLGLVSRITTTTASTGTLTFTPARTSTATSDTALLLNRRNKGFRYQDYKRAINNAIEEFQGEALVPTIESIAAAFSADTQTIAMPATTLEVYKVEFLDPDNIYQEIRKATTRGGYGWTAEPEGSVIRVEGPPAWEADTYAVRVHGYKRQSALSGTTDVVAYDSTALVYTAAAQLCLAAVSKDQRYGNMALTFQRLAEQNKNRVRIARQPGTERVRL